MPSALRALVISSVVVLPSALPAVATPARGVGAEGPASGTTLEVRVVDADTGEGVPWANLLLEGGRGLLADETGRCRIADLPVGDVAFRVLHVAYEDTPWQREPVVAGEARSVTVRLVPFAQPIPPVTIRARRASALVDVARGRASVQVDAASALPNPADDPFQLVRLMPGVSAVDVGSDFYLRGGGVDETLVRIDGMEVRSLFHGRDFGGVTGIVPLGMVSRLDVHAGAFPAELGGRTSGAIDIVLRDAGADGLHGTFAADVTAARALVERNGEASSVFVSAREGYLHRVLDFAQDDAVVEPAYRDLLVRGLRRIGGTTSIRGNWLRVEDHVRYEDEVVAHFLDADYVDHYVWGGLHWLASRDVLVRGTAFGAVSSRRRQSEADHRDDHDARRVGGRVEAALSRGSHVGKAGVEIEREWASHRLRDEGVVWILADGGMKEVDELELAAGRTTDRSAGWVQDEWTPSRRLALNVGLRASHDSYSGDAALSPRAAAAWALPAGLRLRTAWGRHVQPPRGELVGETGMLVLSERVQRADHTVLGLERDLAGLILGVEAWKKRFRPLDAVVGRTVDDIVERHVITEGRSRGVDVSLRHDGRLSHWWFAYSLGRSDWSDGERTYSRDFDALHTLSLANTYRLGNDWDLGISYRFRTGTPYTEQAWRLEEGVTWILDEGEFNAARLPDYHRIDVRIRRHFRFDGWEASLWGEALNLTNHDNVLWYSWRLRDPDGNARQDAERVTRTGVPGLPSVGLEIRF